MVKPLASPEKIVDDFVFLTYFLVDLLHIITVVVFAFCLIKTIPLQ